LSKKKLNRVNKGRLYVTEGEGGGMGVSTDLGAKVNTRKRAVRIDPDVMKDVSAKWGYERDWVSLEVRDTGNEAEKVTFDELFLEDPELFSAVIDDCVLMGVSVNGEGTGGGVEEVGEEISYRYLCEKRYSWCGLT